MSPIIADLAAVAVSQVEASPGAVVLIVVFQADVVLTAVSIVLVLASITDLSEMVSMATVSMETASIAALALIAGLALIVDSDLTADLALIMDLVIEGSDLVDFRTEDLTVALGQDAGLDLAEDLMVDAPPLMGAVASNFYAIALIFKIEPA